MIHLTKATRKSAPLTSKNLTFYTSKLGKKKVWWTLTVGYWSVLVVCSGSLFLDGLLDGHHHQQVAAAVPSIFYPPTTSCGCAISFVTFCCHSRVLCIPATFSPSYYITPVCKQMIRVSSCTRPIMRFNVDKWPAAGAIAYFLLACSSKKYFEKITWIQLRPKK